MQPLYKLRAPHTFATIEMTTSMNEEMECLGAVLMAGPASSRVGISKRRNAVSLHWVPGAGLEETADCNDLKRRLSKTSMLFEELKVSISATSQNCFGCHF